MMWEDSFVRVSYDEVRAYRVRPGWYDVPPATFLCQMDHDCAYQTFHRHDFPDKSGSITWHTSPTLLPGLF